MEGGGTENTAPSNPGAAGNGAPDIAGGMAG